MAEKKTSKKGKKSAKEIKCKIESCCGGHATGGCFYFLGFIGALVYYVSTAPDIWGAIAGFFKAVFWPAFLVYSALVFMGL